MKRELEEKESYEILSKYIQNENEILNFKNHRKHPIRKNVFRFTIDLISLEFLIQEFDKVEKPNNKILFFHSWLLFDRANLILFYYYHSTK